MFVFAIMALGNRVAFCEASLHLGWDVHEHEACGAEHAHEHEEEAPRESDCEPEFSEAQLTKEKSVPAPAVSDIPFLEANSTVLPVAEQNVFSSSFNLEPPEGLPDRFSRSFTGRFLV